MLRAISEMPNRFIMAREMCPSRATCFSKRVDDASVCTYWHIQCGASDRERELGAKEGGYTPTALVWKCTCASIQGLFCWLSRPPHLFRQITRSTAAAAAAAPFCFHNFSRGARIFEMEEIKTAIYRKSLSWEVTRRDRSACWLLACRLCWWFLWWWLCWSELSPETPWRLAKLGSCNDWPLLVPEFPPDCSCRAASNSLPSCWPRDVACKTLCQGGERKKNGRKYE